MLPRTLGNDPTADMASTIEEEISSSADSATWSTFTEPMEDLEANAAVPLRRMPLPLPRCQNYRLFILVALCSVGTLGLVGNGLSAFIFWLYKKKSATVFLLICLSVVDCFVVVVWLVVTCLPLASSHIGDIHYFMYVDAFIVGYVRPIAQTLHMMTTWLTVLVAIQRYLAVCFPHSVAKYGSWRAAAIQAVLVGAFALVFNLVRFLDAEMIETASGRLISAPIEPFDGEIYQKVYEVGLYYAFMYVIPLLILAKITWSLSRAVHERSRMKQVVMVGSSRKSDHLTLPLLVVIIAFMICQLISPIRVLWEKLGNPGQGCDEPFRYFSVLVPVAVVVNSSLNCLIYTVFSPRFRKHFSGVLGCRGLRKLLQMRVAPATSVPAETIGNNTTRNTQASS